MSQVMVWACEECDFRTEDEQAALSHSDELKHSLARTPLVEEGEWSGGERGFFRTRTSRFRVSIHQMLDEDEGLFVAEVSHEGAPGAGSLFIAGTDPTKIVGEAVGQRLGLPTAPDAPEVYSYENMADTIAKFKAHVHQAKLSNFMTRGR